MAFGVGSVFSNRKGINQALDMVEKSIMELERNAKSRMIEDQLFGKKIVEGRSSHVDPEELIKKSKEPKKKSLKSVLLNKTISNTNQQHKLKKGSIKKTKKIGISMRGEKRNLKDAKLTCPKGKPGQHFLSDDRLHYANPTLSHELRGKLCKDGRSVKAATFPFIVEAGQSKSHNLRVIIQQNLMKQKLLPPVKTGNKQQDISREDIGHALTNLEKELNVIKKYKSS